MRIYRLLLVLVFCFEICVAMYSQDSMIDYKEILDKSDATLFSKTGRWNLNVEDYEKNIKKRYSVYECTSGGLNMMLLVSKEPRIVLGQSILRLGDTIYYYRQKIDKLDTISSKVAFFKSTFSQEDILSTQLSNYYELSGYEKTEENGRMLLVLSLEAKSGNVAYQKIRNFIDPDTFQPVRREYYSYSGQMVKVMEIQKIEYNQEKKLSYLELTMYDSLRSGYYSHVFFNSFDYSVDISDKLFTIAYMKYAAR